MIRLSVALVCVVLSARLKAQDLPADTLGDKSFEIADNAGHKSLKGQWRKGKRAGTWVSYYPSGQVASRSRYRNGKLRSIWWYSESGHLIKYLKPNGRVVVKPDCDCGH